MSEYKCENGQPPMFIPHKPVTGVVGAAFSVVSIMVANILRLFKVRRRTLSNILNLFPVAKSMYIIHISARRRRSPINAQQSESHLG